MSDTKELKDFGIQILTVGHLGSKQAKMLSELIGNVCERIDKLEAENEKLKRILQSEVDVGDALIDDIGFDAWLEQALKG